MQRSPRQIPAAIHSYYQQSYPQVYAQRKGDVDQAARAVLAIYNRNVFPDLRVTWGNRVTGSLAQLIVPADPNLRADRDSLAEEPRNSRLKR